MSVAKTTWVILSVCIGDSRDSKSSTPWFHAWPHGTLPCVLPQNVTVWQATLSNRSGGGGARSTSPVNELKQATQPIQPLISGQWAMRMLDQAVIEEEKGVPGERGLFVQVVGRGSVLTTPFTMIANPGPRGEAFEDRPASHRADNGTRVRGSPETKWRECGCWELTTPTGGETGRGLTPPSAPLNYPWKVPRLLYRARS